jgi:hypothetical protein
MLKTRDRPRNMRPRHLLFAALFCAGVGAGLAIGAFLHQPPDLAALHCLPGSRGRVCTVDRTKLSRVGANSIAVPTAIAIPGMVDAGDQVWFQAGGLPAVQPVTVTLVAPDGTSCSVGDVRVRGTTVEAFAVPASCAIVEGVWSATFSAGSAAAVARFLVVQTP